MLLRKIEPIADGRSFALHFDDGSRMRCTEDEILTFGLYAGAELDGGEYEKLCAACEYFRVRQKAAELISRRAMSAGEMKKKLCEKGASEDDAERAAQWLVGLGAIDEGEYASAVVRHYARKGYGRARISAELYRHMVPRGYWEEALGALDECAVLPDGYIYARLKGRRADTAEKKRVCDALVRRGYGYEEISAAMARYEQMCEDAEEAD